MSGLPRFFLSTGLVEGEVTLDGSEAHHLLNVRRLTTGARVELFDGFGHFATAEIVRTSRREAILRVARRQGEIGPAPTLTLAVAFPKPHRARWMVEKLTELGVTKLVPLVTEYAVSSGKPVNPAKLRQFVIDACKQCRRNTLMPIEAPIRLAEFLGRNEASNLLLADHAGGTVGDGMEHATVLIGPEGGFSEGEKQAVLDAGAKRVTFASHVLRVETAALAAAVLLRS